MPVTLWRPADEADAVSTQAVFREWLRAVRGVALTSTETLPDLAAGGPAACDPALADFAGLDPALGWRGNLLRRCPIADPLVLASEAGESDRWSRPALGSGEGLPPPVAAVLAGGGWADLLRLAAGHLLLADTRPDDRLLWLGDPADPWPYGAWLVGARVVLPGRGDPARIAARMGAIPVAAAPEGWTLRPPA